MKLLILVVLLSFTLPLITSSLTTEDETSTANHRLEPKDQNSHAQIAMAIAIEHYQRQSESEDEHAAVANIDPNYIIWGFWINAVLVLATLVIAIFAIVQASAAKRGAKAAMLNAQAVIDAERPWLLVSIEAIKESDMPFGVPDMYMVQAFNAGRTPAEIHEGHCAAEKHPVGFVPPENIQDPFIMPMQNLIVSRDSFEIRKIAPETQIGQAEREGRGMDPQMLYVYGKLSYWDTFADRSAPGVGPYVTQWCFWYDPSRKRFFRCADGGYTKNT